MSGKRAARHAQTNNRRRGLIGAAVVAAVVAAVLAVTLGWLPGSSSEETDGEAAARPSHRAESPSSKPSPEESSPTKAALSKPIRACAQSIRAEERAVEAASQGVTNWHDHVQARTDMLDGRMSVDRMDAVWERTKAAGPGDQERFKAALPAGDQPSKCDGLDDASDSTMATHCMQRSQAAARALDSAEAAMKDWEVHLSNMAMYADKKMSSTMAQDEWVKAWRNAPKNISAYQTARAALEEAPACAPAAS